MNDRIKYVVGFNKREDVYFLEASVADQEQGKFSTIRLCSHHKEDIQNLCDLLNNDKAEIDRLTAENEKLNTEINELKDKK